MNREHKIKNGSKKGFSPLMAALFVLLIVYALLILFPLAWGLGQSLMDGMRLDSTVVPWPSDWQFSNYIDAFVHFYVPVQAEQGTVLVQGIIDAYFEEEDRYVIVDYKTDKVYSRDGRDLAEKYGRQLFYYRKALEQATGREVKEMLIYSVTLGREIPVGMEYPQGTP